MRVRNHEADKNKLSEEKQERIYYKLSVNMVRLQIGCAIKAQCGIEVDRVENMNWIFTEIVINKQTHI